MAMATAKGTRTLRPGKRAFVFSRSAYPGMQRFASTWTGDNKSDWGHLRVSIPMVLNMGLSGQAMTGPDIGGFWGAPTPELMARWFAAGIFYPFHRNHTQDGSPPQEIWSFGPEIERICSAFIRLRYAFLPYIYSLFFFAWKKGWPVMRPLLFHFPDDPRCYESEVADSQYLAGDAVLVAPVVWQGRSDREIYLPGRSENGGVNSWVCYRTHRIFSGGTAIREEVLLDQVPLFIRKGSAIAMSPGIMHAGQAFEGDITIDIYPDKFIHGNLYLDDGLSDAFMDNGYSFFEVKGTAAEKVIELEIMRSDGALSPAWGSVKGLVVRIAMYGERKSSVRISAEEIQLPEKSAWFVEDWLCFRTDVSGAGTRMKIQFG